MTIGERIKKLREDKNISVDKLAELIGKNRATIYRYESNEIEKLPTSVLEPLCKALNTTPAYLMGWTDIEKDVNKKTKEKSNLSAIHDTNIYMRPVYNSVAAGFGTVADNTVVDYMPTYIGCPSEQELYIWVNVSGDSMSPLIDDGSKILIKKQTSVDSGQIAVVLIDNEDAVVKKVMYGDDWIELQSVNPYYPPRRFEGADVQRIQILGLVKEVSKTLQ